MYLIYYDFEIHINDYYVCGIYTYDIWHLLWLILWYTLSLSLKGVPKHSHDDANTILVFEVGQLTLSLRLQSWSWTKARCRGVWMESMVGTSRGWFTLYNPTWCKCAAWTTPSETAPKPQPSNRNSHQRMFRSKYNKIYVCACMYVLTIYTYIHTIPLPLHYITFHYITVITLHYIHYITLHCITLYYITLSYHIISYHTFISIHIKSYHTYRTVPCHTIPTAWFFAFWLAGAFVQLGCAQGDFCLAA